MDLEKEKDRLAASESELDERRRELMHKRIELEKTDSLKDLTTRLVHEVSFEKPVLYVTLFIHSATTISSRSPAKSSKPRPKQRKSALASRPC